MPPTSPCWLNDDRAWTICRASTIPLNMPVMSLGETQMRPTAMLFRNLLAMEVEESIRANPIDGVVLLGGCDKTTPGQMMGAASVDLPTMVLSSGPMLNGKFRGKDIGSGTDVWRFSEAVRAGDMSLGEFMAAESGMSRSHGTCMTMGTASTMASLVEGLGLSLPQNAALPGVDSAEVRGDTVHLHARDTDAVARYLLTRTGARDLEITSRNLEDAFRTLTAEENPR